MILPGATLGVLGGGQLGRMFCMAARNMGYRTWVLDPDSQSPAAAVADQHIQADYTDQKALAELAEQCDAITTEFENVPAESLKFLSSRKPVHPSADAVAIARHRIQEKDYAKKVGLSPAPYARIRSVDDIESAIQHCGLPAIIKTTTLGYDGKGQQIIHDKAQLKSAFNELGGVECVLEKKMDLALEISVLLARNSAGDVESYPPAENDHINGILHRSIVPARVDEGIAEQARQQAVALANALAYVGVLAVEFFITADNQLIFNEMAPRPHNSGHYTQDAAVTSQFEQQVRVMCGLPPGDTGLTSPVVMVNLLGDLWPVDWRVCMNNPSLKLHLYGKHEARSERKMGHFNLLANDLEQAIRASEQIFMSLESHQSTK
ncbi:N5-carboxyaminoimidazole ribonucleotide synthase [hydrothermal vent metagenome]|uniref:N5-carboxyaminoimidazole ribonucleotide synthase n=1 Tax=hydrothermal vent metagenome TaxID=652676 RepID=A0A3B0XEW8_9ZZZZ